MAFDAAAAGQRPPRSRASSGVASGADGRGGDGGNELKQRVWTLMQTGKSIESMTGALGTANDTTLLRSKLVAEETTAASLINEIDSGIRKMRVATMRDQDRDSSAARALDRLNDQYNEVRKRVVDAVRLSQQRQRQYVPTEVPMPPPKQQQQQRKASPTQDLPNPFGGQQPGSYDSSSSSQPQVVLEMRRLGDVEDTIARERAAEAAAIAKEAVEIHGMMSDVSGMVQEQAEGVQAIEDRVDETLSRVQEGNNQLVKAAEYQKSYRKKLCLFAMCVVALIGVVVVPIVIHYLPTLTNKSGSGGGGGGGGGGSSSNSPSASSTPSPSNSFQFFVPLVPSPAEASDLSGAPVR